jgi:hypothetical protein
MLKGTRSQHILKYLISTNASLVSLCVDYVDDES